MNPVTFLIVFVIVCAVICLVCYLLMRLISKEQDILDLESKELRDVMERLQTTFEDSQKKIRVVKYLTDRVWRIRTDN